MVDEQLHGTTKEDQQHLQSGATEGIHDDVVENGLFESEDVDLLVDEAAEVGLDEMEKVQGLDADVVAQSEKQAEAIENGDADASEIADTDEAGEDEDDALDVPMDKVEAVLNAEVDRSSATPQMRRMMARQAENTKRVEESIKGTKSNPRWFVPLFCTLMIIGLIWAVVYYLTSTLNSGAAYPIPALGMWNLAVAFAFILVGFIMTMWWR